MGFPLLDRKGRSVKAISPVVSTVVLTGTIIALISVAFVFANSLLWSRIAESEFNSAKQFMQTMGLQVDDVAWTIGRTETIRYSSRYGAVTVLPSALNYTIYIKREGSSTYEPLVSYDVSVLLFSIPISQYSVFEGYYELIFPSSTSTLTQKGTSSPVVRVFAIEKNSFTRVAIAPSIRLLNSTMTTSGSTTLYVRLYLPILTLGSSPRLSQSVTLTGNSIVTTTVNSITSINVTVSFPNEASGFDNSFFHFPSTYEVITIPDGYSDKVLEFYAGEVYTSLGINP